MSVSTIGKYVAVTAQNTFSPELLLGENGPESMQLSVHGTFVANVVLQIKRPDQSAWRDLETFTAPVDRIFDFIGTYSVRAGVKTGGFTSGTVEIELS